MHFPESRIRRVISLPDASGLLGFHRIDRHAALPAVVDLADIDAERRGDIDLLEHERFVQCLIPVAVAPGVRERQPVPPRNNATQLPLKQMKRPREAHPAAVKTDHRPRIAVPMQSECFSIPLKINRIGERTTFRKRSEFQKDDAPSGKRILHREQSSTQCDLLHRGKAVFVDPQKIVMPVRLIRKHKFAQFQMCRGRPEALTAGKPPIPNRLRNVRVNLQPGRIGRFRFIREIPGTFRRSAFDHHRRHLGRDREMVMHAPRRQLQLQQRMQRRSSGLRQRSSVHLKPGPDLLLHRLVAHGEQLLAVKQNRYGKQPPFRNPPAAGKTPVPDRDDSRIGRGKTTRGRCERFNRAGQQHTHEKLSSRPLKMKR